MWLQTLLESLSLLKPPYVSKESPFLSTTTVDEEDKATEALIKEALETNVVFFVRDVPTEWLLRTFQEDVLHIEVNML
jgi:hypothetical protein